MQAGSKPDPSIIEMVTRVLAAPGSPDTAWIDTAILGKYGTNGLVFHHSGCSELLLRVRVRTECVLFFS